jgi:hypothetical protein
LQMVPCLEIGENSSDVYIHLAQSINQVNLFLKNFYSSVNLFLSRKSKHKAYT